MTRDELIDQLQVENIKLQSKLDKVNKRLTKITKHETLDGEKYNNYNDAYYGIVEFCKETLEELTDKKGEG